MGWAGGTDVMDATIKAFDELTEKVFDFAHQIVGSKYTLSDALQKDVGYRARLDDLLRPHVRQIASLLEDRGWDCQEEADQFDRFSQEIIGYDDNAYEGFLRYRVTEATQDGTPDDIVAAAARLKAHTDKMKAGKA